VVLAARASERARRIASSAVNGEVGEGDGVMRRMGLFSGSSIPP
jgi:hypothetical protein